MQWKWFSEKIISGIIYYEQAYFLPNGHGIMKQMQLFQVASC